jgi:hypothetical protein
MAEDGSWPNILKYGLLSTTAILDKWEIVDNERNRLESQLRPKIITLNHKKYGEAKLRDQKAMKPDLLSKCLPKNISIEDWCRYINGKVFFWTNWSDLKIFLSAQSYINKPHVVITLDTIRLVNSYRKKITLSDMNTGSTFPRKGKIEPEQRDFSTFKKIADFDAPWVKELSVDYGIIDIANFVLSVKRYVATKKGNNSEPVELEEIWIP